MPMLARMLLHMAQRLDGIHQPAHGGHILEAGKGGHRDITLGGAGEAAVSPAQRHAK